MRISLILEAIDGVRAVDTDPGRHTATVTFDPSRTTVEAMIQAIEHSSGQYEGRFHVLDVKFLK
jgi:copper chaperone CopZ